MKYAFFLTLLLCTGCTPGARAKAAHDACYVMAEQLSKARSAQLCPLDQPWADCPHVEQLSREYDAALGVCDAALD